MDYLNIILYMLLFFFGSLVILFFIWVFAKEKKYDRFAAFVEDVMEAIFRLP